ncbi:MAG: hypothetical protein ACYTF6_03245 [Planctomycetota bacterium]|jgi:hypothetical protein
MAASSWRISLLVALVLLAACAALLGTTDARPASGDASVQPGGRNWTAAGVSAPRLAPPGAKRSRYRTLLRQIHVPGDRATYGDFYDWGYWSGTEYAGHKDLPRGYWVYLCPHWYIFKEDVSDRPKRAWGPEQATGAPDTPGAGDIKTAWASKTPDGQREWLELEYATPVMPLAVLVYETYNPGALCQVSVFDANGHEQTVWSGSDPTSDDRDKGISVIPFQTEYKIDRLRIYLDSPKVNGWNEIDAVGLLGADGVTQWAIRATASSTYAER